MALCAVTLAAEASGQSFSLAYVAHGDLWIQSGPHTPARRVTRGGTCKSPHFSTDGSLLAFQDGNGVSVFSFPKADIVKLTVSPAEWQFSWSPVGNLLAVWNTTGLYLFSQRDSWAAQKIVSVDLARSIVLDVVFNHDGQKLLIATRNAGIKGGAAIGAIDVVDLQDLQRTSTLSTEAGSGFILYGLSPDGGTIAFWKDPGFSSSIQADGLDLYTMSIASGTVRQLNETRTLVHKDLLNWAPDGKSLLLTLVGSGLGRETWADRPLAEIDVLNGNARIVSLPNTSTLFPAWSPDGEEIAYVQAPEGKDSVSDRKIWIAQRSGDEKRQLTSGGEYREERPVWISDEAILFCRIDTSYNASLWFVAKDGQHLAQVAELGTLPEKAAGYFGYLSWAELFDVWTPSALCGCRVRWK